MPFPNFIGRKRFWTKERVLSALQQAAAEIEGPLPCLDRAYSRIKKGRLEWPTARRVLEYFGSMARGWMAAGAGMERVSLHNVPWVLGEDSYLLEYAGTKTLALIGAELGRSYQAVRARLNQYFKVSARANQGFLSAAELSKEYGCPYHRVRTALQEGVIPGCYDRVRNRWEIDEAKLTPAAEALLRSPKLHSYRNSPPDLGDYYSRYGLIRKQIEGKVVTLSRDRGLREEVGHDTMQECRNTL